jgi:hypothetical protein
MTDDRTPKKKLYCRPVNQKEAQDGEILKNVEWLKRSRKRYHFGLLFIYLFILTAD